MDTFQLYHTFTAKPTDKVGNVTTLLNKIKELDNEKQNALFMLICEHAKEDGLITELYENGALEKYGIETNNCDIQIDFSKLPKKLQIIISKFVSTVCNTTT